MSDHWFRDGSDYVLVRSGQPQDAVEIGIGHSHDDAINSLEGTAIQSTGRDGGLRSALIWAQHAGQLTPPDDLVILETMPEHLRESHRSAGNWGVYPHNGAEREVVEREEAEEAVANDPDEYDSIIRDAEPIDWLDEDDGPDEDNEDDEDDEDAEDEDEDE